MLTYATFQRPTGEQRYTQTKRKEMEKHTSQKQREHIEAPKYIK